VVFIEKFIFLSVSSHYEIDVASALKWKYLTFNIY